MSSSSHSRRLLPGRRLSLAAGLGVAVLGLATTSTPTFAAARSSVSAGGDFAGRGAPYLATQRSQAQSQHPNITLSAPTCNDQWNVVSSGNAGTNDNNELSSVS